MQRHPSRVREVRLLVETLLNGSFVFLDITGHLLFLVARNGTGDGIPFTLSTVHGSIDVTFGLGSIELGCIQVGNG